MAYLRPLHTTTETAKNTHYNFFSQFVTVLDMDNDFYNDFFRKIFVKIFVVCEGLETGITL